MESRGFFITFEGVDGCGKGTQIKLLKQLFEEQNIKAMFTREPGGSPVSEKIRNLLLDKENVDITDTCEMLLFAASRALLVEKDIIPALNNGTIVVCDRFVDSSIAYQGGARGLGVELVRELNKIATKGLVPDLTILLDLDGETGAKRNAIAGDKDDRMEEEGVSFQDKVRQTYLSVAQSESQRFLVVDATKTVDEIFSIIKQELQKRGVINNA